MTRKWAAQFFALFAIGLAIASVVLALSTDDSLSHGRVATMTFQAVLTVGVGSVFVLFLHHGITVWLPRVLRRVAVRVTFKTVRLALAERAHIVEPSGITPIEDDVGVGLPLGLQDGLTTGERFVVLNTASQAKWGVLQVSQIQENSCVCTVFDRINPNFWDSLEGRMRHDASPPQGVSIRREIPEEYLLDWLSRLLKAPRG